MGKGIGNPNGINVELRNDAQQRLNQTVDDFLDESGVSGNLDAINRLLKCWLEHDFTNLKADARESILFRIFSLQTFLASIQEEHSRLQRFSQPVSPQNSPEQ